MKILVVAPYFPFPPNSGGAIRVYNQIKHFSSQHEIFLAFPDNEQIDEVDLAAAHKMCAKLLPFPTAPAIYTGFDLRRLRAWRSLSSLRPLILRDTVPNISTAVAAILAELKGEQPDLIHAHQFHMAELGLALKKSLGKQVKLLLDEHNCEPRIWKLLASESKRIDRKIVFGWEAKKLEHKIKHFYPVFDIVTAVSQEDKEALEQLTKRQDIIVVPNGVDTQYFSRVSSPVPVSDEILFTGTLGYEPNIDGLLYFHREIWPKIQAERPQTRLLIVGRNAPPVIKALNNGSSIQVIGPVEDIRPYYERARVYIVPLRWGGGTRLKVLEALAMQMPLVSTTAGISGINLTLGDHYLCGDTPESFASLTLRLLDIKGPAKHLALKGRKFVEDYYDWTRINAIIENIYISVLLD